MNKYIIDGYNGIMPLDLTNIDKKHHKNMIIEHQKNIEEYKLEQDKLPHNLKYENCIQKVYKQLKKEEYHKNQRIQKKIKQQEEIDKNRIKSYKNK